MKDQDLPEELQRLFLYANQRYGWWEIRSTELNQCDSYEKVPQVRNNELKIILHPNHWNDNTYFHWFKIVDGKVELKILATRFNGRDYYFDKPVKSKGLINKVIKWLEEKEQENGRYKRCNHCR